MYNNVTFELSYLKERVRQNTMVKKRNLSKTLFAYNYNKIELFIAQKFMTDSSCPIQLRSGLFPFKYWNDV